MKKMRYLKKLTNVFLTMVMALALALTANAAGEKYTITIKNDATGHTYEAYQIFKGDLHDGKLSNIAWGSGVNASELGDAVTKAETLTDDAAAKAFAKEVAQYLTTPSATSSFNEASKNYTISGLEAGYYLIKDKNGSITGDDTYTGYILKVVGNVETAPKGDKPEVEKKVQDTNDSTGDTSEWQDSADYDIGDDVPFQLTGTLPTNYADYKFYTYIFHDTMSEGLTYNNDAKVEIDGVDVTEFFTIETDDLEGKTKLTISCEDLKKIEVEGLEITASSTVVVTYTAKLNENAKFGVAGNPNEVYLEYSNNPNYNGEPGDEDNPTGETPKDVVIVFTFKTIVNKVDGEGKPLTGAEFTLEKYNSETETWETVVVVKNDEGTVFTFSGLDDGIYRLTETKTPDGYNTIQPIYFAVVAEHDVTSDDPTLTSLVVKSVSGSEGSFVIGDDLGDFTISMDKDEISTNIVNRQGPELPSTGGIGTTIFYVVGSALMLGAAVLLITKKKMSGNK